MKNTIKHIGVRFIQRTITRDLSFGLALIISLSLISIGGLIFFISTYQTEQSLHTIADDTAQELSDILSLPMWNLDIKTVTSIADVYRQAENVAGIHILDEGGNTVYSSFSLEDNLITAHAYIMHEQHQIGTLTVDISSNLLRVVQVNILLVTSITLILVVSVVLIATGFLLEYSLNRPLQNLTTGIDRIAGGDYSRTLEHAPQADIDEIAQRVNTMAAQISLRIDALHRERDIISRIMQTSPVGITMLNRKGHVIFANSQARKILGLDIEQATQRSYRASDGLLPELTEKLYLERNLPFSGIISHTEPVYDVQQSYKQADGREILLSINSAPIFNEGGQVDGMVATVDDVTDRIRSEAELHQKLAELETVQRISTVLRTAKTLDEMLPRLLDETLAILGTNAGAIALFDPADSKLYTRVARGWFDVITEKVTIPGHGLVGQTFLTGKPYISREFAKDPIIQETTRAILPAGWSGASIPIRSVDENMGVLLIAVEHPRQLVPENVHLLITLAEIAGNAFHRTQLHTQTERRLQRLTALRTLDMAISSNADLHLTMNILIEQIIKHLGVDAAAVLLFNPHSQALEFAAGRGFRSDSLTPTRLNLGQGLAGKAALERKIITIQDWHSDEGLQDSSAKSILSNFDEESFISYYGMPLIVKDEVKGVLEIFNRTMIISDPEWMDFLAILAGQAAIAIDDAQLFSSLQRSNAELELAYDTTLEGWSRALDLRDRETEGHTRRVATMTTQLARILGLSEDEIAQMRRGALLHDIGKMGIPDDILLKPGPLTEKEWLTMRKHPTYAYEMLLPIHYLHAALDIPYYHHEKWDGTGYPQGLKGEYIPLAARIFAVVDVWDALTADRPYRLAWPRERTLDYICQQSGMHFDPKVVKAFIELIKNY